MKKGESVYYEWQWRLYDDEFEDVIDADYCSTYADAVDGLARAWNDKGADITGASIELCRMIGNEDDGLADVQYCWANGDAMNTDFNHGARVPKRYLEEFYGFTGKRPDVNWYEY